MNAPPAQQHQKASKKWNEHRVYFSLDLVKPFTSIQVKNSLRGSCITVKVYIQEMSSRLQIKRLHQVANHWLHLTGNPSHALWAGRKKLFRQLKLSL